MVRTLLSEGEWEKIEALLPGKEGDCGVTAADNRLFMEAVLWIARTGSPWRDLPAEFGNWHTTYTRFNRWSKKGVWHRVMTALSDEPDVQELMIDSTVIRAHQHAAGAKKKAGTQALGYSRGGFSTKIHIAVDAKGEPVNCILSEGQAADITYAQALIEGLPAQAVLGDKGYDADHFLRYLEEHNIEAVIPPRANRLEQRDYDRDLYKDRNLVERFFSRIKHFRRVATRYEKLARNFLAMITLVCTYVGME